MLSSCRMRHANAIKLLVALLLAALFPPVGGGKAPSALRQERDCAQDSARLEVAQARGAERPTRAGEAAVAPQIALPSPAVLVARVPVPRGPKLPARPEVHVHPGPSPPVGARP